MEEADDPIGARIRQSEIPENGLSAVLARHDMIGVKRQRVRGSREATILAPVLRALPTFWTRSRFTSGRGREASS
jgi:hypothetical protein